MKTPLRTAMRVLLASGMLMAAFTANAQLKVGDRPYSINRASVLELESDRQGLLLPRVQPGMLTTAPLNTAPDGMIVVVENATHQNQTLYLRKDGAWVKLATLDEAEMNWSREGNTVNDATDFLGSRNSAALVFKTNDLEAMRIDATGNIGIGTNNPTAKLDVLGNGQISGNLLVSGIIAATTGQFSGALSSNSLSVANGVNFANLAASTSLVNVLVIDPVTGDVNRRQMSAAAFDNAISTMNGSQEAIQSFATGTAGTDFNVATLLGVHTFNIPTAGTGITRGLLTEADWDKLQASQKQVIAAAFSNTPDANGLTIGGTDNNELSLHAADATNPGGVSVAAQTFGGEKTFQDKVTAAAGIDVAGAANLAGTATIDGLLTLNTVDATAATGPYNVLIQGAGNVIERRLIDIAALENGVQRISDGTNNTIGPDITFNTTTNNNDFGITVDGVAKTVSFNLPDASGEAGSEARGAVSTTTQSFAGDKSFAQNVNVGATTAGNSTLQVTGSISMAIKTVNTDGYPITDKDHTILVDATSAALTVNLPAAVEGRVYTIKKIGTGGIDNEVTIAPNGSAQVEGGPNYTIYNDWTFVTLQSDGTNWYIIRK
ncbi:hypothetical protein [Chitinophaga sp. XS-30]|uniref:hypothetical protein n=1 Tax=Chitinophaga sp. XS-30 TaxID=2604421 RepID=UPI0011DE1057|nr:hypothetical protein [Chitinophaga sp. XS-30]QEH41241.1 hypothetical protein FW415_10280 [Chitinophaga sp. XS-30]